MCFPGVCVRVCAWMCWCPLGDVLAGPNNIVLGRLHGRTCGLAKPTILLVDNAEDAMPHARALDDADGAVVADSPSSGIVATLSQLLEAAPAGCLRLLVTSRVPVPVQGGAGSFSLEPLSIKVGRCTLTL
jgi:hypothetical protein